MMLKNFLLVAVGGGIGSVLRYGFSLLQKSGSLPYSTFLINIIGSFLLGMLMASIIKNDSPAVGYRLFFTTGFCGGFTTFSAFSYENVWMLQQGKYNLVFLYVLASVISGIGAAWVGFKIIHH